MATKTVRVCDICHNDIPQDQPIASVTLSTVDYGGHTFYPKKVRYALGNPQRDPYSQGECCFTLECITAIAEWTYRNHLNATPSCDGNHSSKNNY